MKTRTILLLSLLLSCLYGCKPKTDPIITPKEYIEWSIKKHDPKNQWKNTEMMVHITEPRITNPYRYSIVKIDNHNDYFELSRSRGEQITKHIIDRGNSQSLLNNVLTIDTTLIKKYSLQPERNNNYKKFYQLLLGLPMSLKDKMVKSFNESSVVDFNEVKTYKIELELQEKIISEYWNIYIDILDHSVVGVDIVSPESPEKGDRIYFTGNIKINDLNIPRFRHWHKLTTNEYSGSDIIVKTHEE